MSFTSASIEFRIVESSKINDRAANIRKTPSRSDCSMAGSVIGSRKITSIWTSNSDNRPRQNATCANAEALIRSMNGDSGDSL